MIIQRIVQASCVRSQCYICWYCPSLPPPTTRSTATNLSLLVSLSLHSESGPATAFCSVPSFSEHSKSESYLLSLADPNSPPHISLTPHPQSQNNPRKSVLRIWHRSLPPTLLSCSSPVSHRRFGSSRVWLRIWCRLRVWHCWVFCICWVCLWIVSTSLCWSWSLLCLESANPPLSVWPVWEYAFCAGWDC